MKTAKLIVPLCFCFALLFACGNGEDTNSSGTSSTESKDIVALEIVQLIDNYKAGLQPVTPIANVKNFDANAKENLNSSGKFIGFQSETEKENLAIRKYYSTKFNDEKNLKACNVSFEVLDAYDEDDNEDPSKVIEYQKYVDLINKHLPDAQYEKFNGDDSWELDNNTFVFSYSEYDVSFEVIRY